MLLRKILRISRGLPISKRLNVLNRTNYRYLRSSASNRGIFEPDEEELNPDIPEYETVNVSLRGYDFAILESFTSYCHRLAHKLNITADCYPVPPRTSRVQVYKPYSAVPDKEYQLSLCERVVQLDNVSSISLPLYIQAVQMSQPQGIQVEFKYPSTEEDEFRYIPDKELISLNTQLEDMDNEKLKKKKR